jgi:hypothetical protein
VPPVTTRLAAPVGLALALAVSGSAAAAQIQTDHVCYPTPATGIVAVAVTASGLDAGQPFSIALDRKVVASGTTDAAGEAATTIDVPRLGRTEHTSTRTLVLTEGANTATTTFGVARVFASFSPSTGNPGKLRVRFSGTGFAMQKARPSVYVHEVAPDGRARRTFALGHATGPCGTISSAKRVRLFPTPPGPGTWHLQFDTSKTYHRGRAAFLYYTLAVIVSR